MPQPSGAGITQPNMDAPGVDLVPVTPNDATDLAFEARALYFGAAGNVAVITSAGNTRTIPVAANMVLPLRVGRVLVTGTTVASGNIFAFV